MSKSTKKVAGDRHIAGENNGRFFKFKVAEKFYQINTNNFHNYDHAWKWSRGSVSALPWRYFCWFWLRSQIAAQMRTWYNDNMAITFFLSNTFWWKVSYFAPLDESSQKQVLLQNNSITKSIKLILGAREVQGPPCCINQSIAGCYICTSVYFFFPTPRV